MSGALVRDVRVLPQTVLGCASSTWNPQDPVPYVYHMFKGSWRHEKPSGLRLFLARLAPALFPLPPEDKHHHNESGRGGGGAGASAAADGSQKQQQGQGKQVADNRRLRMAAAAAAGRRVQAPQHVLGGDLTPSLELGAVPVLAVVLVAAAVCGVALGSSRGGGAAARMRAAGWLPVSGGGSGHGSGHGSHGSLQQLGGKCSGSLDEHSLLGMSQQPRSASPSALLRMEAQVACVTGSAAQAPQAGRHSHKRSWGSFAALPGTLQQL